MEITIPPTSYLKNSPLFNFNSSLFHAPSEGCPPEQRIVQSGQRLPCGAVGQAGLRQLKDLLRPPDSGRSGERVILVAQPQGQC